MSIKSLGFVGIFLLPILPLLAADSSGNTNAASSLVIRVYPLSERILKTLIVPEDHPSRAPTNSHDAAWIVKNDELEAFFTRSGVPFPPGASVTYNHRLGALAIMNTHQNLEIVDRIVEAVCSQTRQVTVETRFLQVPRTLAEDLFADEEGLSKACIIKEKILKRIDDLARHGKITELARPKMTTVSGNTAQVKSTKEVMYPDIGFSSASTTNAVSPRESWEGTAMTREVGYLLNATPTIGPDGSTLNITLVPEVSRVAPKPRQYNFTTPSGKVTVEHPEFLSFQTTTTVMLRSGQTMLLAVMDPVVEDGKLTQNDVVFVLLSATVVRE